MLSLYRCSPRDEYEDVISIYVFALPEGLACVVSWSMPEPGLRAFTPSPARPDAINDGLIHAQARLAAHGARRISIELESGVLWDPEWGHLLDIPLD